MVTRHFMTLFVRPELFFGSRSDFVMFEMREMLLSDFLTIYKKIVELTEGATWFLNIMLSELLLQCIKGVCSNPAWGRKQICWLKNIYLSSNIDDFNEILDLQIQIAKFPIVAPY